MADNKEMCFF